MAKKTAGRSATALVPAEVEQQIFTVRGQRVMLDVDLAALYGVTTKRLNEQVKRNLDRFPKDFMFQLTLEEGQSVRASRSQIATLKRGQNIKYAPYVFTEHGAVMLASVLNSRIAVQASIRVVRAFVRLRTILAAHKELAAQLDVLEQKYEKHDEHFETVFAALRQLLTATSPTRRQIGFRSSTKKR
jgi:antitoxin component of MazEF toxin-antitoxin module